MTGEEALFAYIKKEVKKGFDEKAIRAALNKAGYKQDAIDSAFLFYNREKQKTEGIEASAETQETKPKEEHHKVSKIYWLIVLFIFLLLCGAGLIYVKIFYLAEESAAGDEMIENNVVVTEKKQSLFDAINFCEGVVKASITQCRNITDQDLKGECLYYLSLYSVLDSGSVSSCYYNSKASFKSICLYTAKEEKNNCRDHCDVVLANLAANYNSCPQDKPYCRTSLIIWKAAKEKDLTLCASIKDTAKKTLCMAMAKDDVSACRG